MTFESLVATVGFPIAMCCYLVFKFEKTIEKNTKAVNNLTLFLNGYSKKK